MRRAIICLLVAAAMLVGGVVTPLEAGEPVFTKASDLWALAQKAMQTGDKDARLIKAEYLWGKADLTFRTADFVFNAPILHNQGRKRSSVHITLRDGKIKGMWQEIHPWLDEAAPEPDPGPAFEAAKAAGLGDWLAKHTEAGLSIKLEPWNKALPVKRGKSLWVWQVRGWGPGVPKEFGLFLDAGDMSVLGGPSAPGSSTDGKAQQPSQPDATDTALPGSAKKPGVGEKKPADKK